MMVRVAGGVGEQGSVSDKCSARAREVKEVSRKPTLQGGTWGPERWGAFKVWEGSEVTQDKCGEKKVGLRDGGCCERDIRKEGTAKKWGESGEIPVTEARRGESQKEGPASRPARAGDSGEEGQWCGAHCPPGQERICRRISSREVKSH